MWGTILTSCWEPCIRLRKESYRKRSLQVPLLGTGPPRQRRRILLTFVQPSDSAGSSTTNIDCKNFRFRGLFRGYDAHLHPRSREYSPKGLCQGSSQVSTGKRGLLETILPLYGPAGSGDYLHATFLRHIKPDLVMTLIASDLSLLYRTVQIQLQLHGLIATHVDDTLSTGTKLFEHQTL